METPDIKKASNIVNLDSPDFVNIGFSDGASLSAPAEYASLKGTASVLDSFMAGDKDKFDSAISAMRKARELGDDGLKQGAILNAIAAIDPSLADVPNGYLVETFMGVGKTEKDAEAYLEEICVLTEGSDANALPDFDKLDAGEQRKRVEANSPDFKRKKTVVGLYGVLTTVSEDNPDFDYEKAKAEYRAKLEAKNTFQAFVNMRNAGYPDKVIRDAFRFKTAFDTRNAAAEAYVDNLLSTDDEDYTRQFMAAVGAFSPEVRRGFFDRVMTRIAEDSDDRWGNIRDYLLDSNSDGIRFYELARKMKLIDGNGNLISDSQKVEALKNAFEEERNIAANRAIGGHMLAKAYANTDAQKLFDAGKRQIERRKLVRELMNANRTRFEKRGAVSETLEEALVNGFTSLEYLGLTLGVSAATGNPLAGIAASSAMMYLDEASNMYEDLRYDGNVDEATASTAAALYGIVASGLEQVQVRGLGRVFVGKKAPYSNFREYINYGIKESLKNLGKEAAVQTATELATSVDSYMTKKFAADFAGATYDERELFDEFRAECGMLIKTMPLITLGFWGAGVPYRSRAYIKDVGANAGSAVRAFFKGSDTLKNNVIAKGVIKQSMDYDAYIKSKYGRNERGREFLDRFLNAKDSNGREAALKEYYPDAEKREEVKVELEAADKAAREAQAEAIKRSIEIAQKRQADDEALRNGDVLDISVFDGRNENGEYSVLESAIDALGMRENVVFAESAQELSEISGISLKAAEEQMSKDGAMGFTSMSDGKIIILKPHLKNGLDALQTFVHEYGHGIMKNIRENDLGGYRRMCDDVLNILGGESMARLSLPEAYSKKGTLQYIEDGRAVAEEILMGVVERVAAKKAIDAKSRGIWARVRAWFKSLFEEKTLAEIADEKLAQMALDVLQRERKFTVGAADAKPSKNWRAKTPENNGEEVSGQWQVIDADALITSTDEGFDDRLQPRNRSRRASKEQTSDIAVNLDPERLNGSITTDLGAPIVDSRGMVLSGNGRTLAIRQAYGSEKSDRADAYRSFAENRAREMGLEIPAGVKKPVLVRRVDNFGKMSAEEFAARSNKSQIAGMSVAEQAVADGRRVLAAGLLDYFFPDANGNVLAASNADFINAFLEQVGGSEMYRNSDGSVRSNLSPRIKAAVLAAMLDSDNRETVERLLDNPEGFNALVGGLMQSAANLAELSNKPEYDISEELSQAVELFVEMRNKGMKLADFSAQGDFFRAAPSDEVMFLMGLFEENAKTPSGISGVLKQYARECKKIDTTTMDMFGTENPSKIEKLEQARDHYAADIAQQDANADLRGKYKEEGPTDEEIKEVERQIKEVKAKWTNPDGTMKKGYHCAPNGKPSRLTEEQWLLVRTPNFKKWFGDWEKRAYAYAAMDFLENTAPVKELSGQEFQKSETSLTDRVAEYFDSIGNIAHNEELGDVVLDKEGIHDSIGHGLGRLKASAFMAVKDVIEHGFIFNRETNWKNRQWDSAVVIAPVKIGAENYVCEVIVARHPTKNKFYLHEVEIKRTLEEVFKTPTKGRTSQASKLILGKHLAEVKGNVSQVVDENGEPLVVYHGTRATSRFNVFKGSEHFFSDNKEVADGFLNGNDFVLEINGDKYPVSRRDLEVIASEIFGDSSDFENLLGDFDAGELSYGGVSEILSDITHNEYTVEALEDFPLSIKEGGRIVEAFLNIRNPVEINYGGATWQAGKVMPEQDLENHQDADGLIGRNIREGGLTGELRNGGDFPISTDYVVRDSTQIKSATENVGTYNKDNPDIRWSIREDSEIEKINKQFRELYDRYKGGDQAAYEEAVKMVADYAKSKGYDVKVYHGTGADGFNVADATSKYEENGEGAQAHGMGLYLATSRETAEGYRRDADKQKTITAGGRNIKEFGITPEKIGISQSDFGRVIDDLYKYGVDEVCDDIERNLPRDVLAGWRKRLADRDFILPDDEDTFKNYIRRFEKEVAHGEKLIAAAKKIDSILKDNNVSLKITVGEGKVFDWFTNLKPERLLYEKSLANQEGHSSWDEDFFRYAIRENETFWDAVREKIEERNKGKSEAEIDGIYDNAEKNFEYEAYDTESFLDWLEGIGFHEDEKYKLLSKCGFQGIAYDGRLDGRCYVSFEGGSAVKLQDPFTFDDNGELIPLTERFDETNPDMRWKFDGKVNAEFFDTIKSVISEIEKIQKSGMATDFDSLKAQYEKLDSNGKKILDLKVAKLNPKQTEYFGITDAYVYTSMLDILDHHFNHHAEVDKDAYFKLPDVVYDADIVAHGSKANSFIFGRHLDKWHIATNIINKDKGRAVIYKNLFLTSKGEKLFNKKKIIRELSSWEDRQSSIQPTLSDNGGDGNISARQESNSQLTDSENNFENQEKNSRLRFLLRQERTENPVIWASIVLAKEIYLGRKITAAKLETVLPSSKFDGTKREYAVSRAKEIADRYRINKEKFGEKLDLGLQRAESDLYWRRDVMDEMYASFRADGEEYGYIKARLKEWLKNERRRDLENIKGLSSDEIGVDVADAIGNAIDAEPERPKPSEKRADESDEEDLEEIESSGRGDAEISDKTQADERFDTRGVIAKIRLATTKIAKQKDFDEFSRRRLYRNTLVATLTDAAKKLSYGIERERILGKISELAGKPYVALKIKDGDRAGQIVDNYTLRAENIALRIFKRGVRDSKKAMTEKLDAILKRRGKKPSRMQRDDKRSMTGLVQQRIYDISRYVKMDAEALEDVRREAIAKLEDVDKNFVQDAEKGKIREDVEDVRAELENVLHDLEMFGGWADKSRAEMAQALEFLEKTIDTETAAQRERVEKRKERNAAVRKIISDALKMSGHNAARDGGMRVAIRKVLNGSLPFDSFLGLLGESATGETRKLFEEWRRDLVARIDRAANAKANEVFQTQQRFIKLVEDSYSANFHDALKRLLEKKGEYEKFSKPVNGMRQPMSLANVIQLYVSAAQKNYERNFYEHRAARSPEYKKLQDEIDEIRAKFPDRADKMGAEWEDAKARIDALEEKQAQMREEALADYLKSIEAVLSDGDKRFIEGLRQLYKDELPSISAVAKRVIGLPIEQADALYMPVKVKRSGNLGEGVPQVPVVPKSLSQRVPHLRDLDETADPISLFTDRISENAQFKHFSELYIEMRGIFGDGDLQDLIKQRCGADVLTGLKEFIADIATGKTRGPQNELLRKTNGLTAVMLLGFNLGSGVRQVLPGVASFAPAIGGWNVFKNMMSFFTPEGFAAALEICRSDTGRRRFEIGNMQIMEELLSTPDRNRFWAAYKRHALFFNRFADKLSIMFIGQGIYRSGVGEYLRRGFSEAEAKKLAMSDMWQIAERTQASGRTHNMSHWQRRGGEYGKALGLFSSPPQLMFSMAYAKCRRALALGVKTPEGRAAVWDALSTLFYVSVCVEGSYALSGVLWNALLKGFFDDDDGEQILKQMALGPFGGLFVFGRIIEGAGSNYGTSLAPIEQLSRPLRHTKNLLFDAGQFDADKALEDLDKLAKSLFPLYRDGQKLYENLTD